MAQSPLSSDVPKSRLDLVVGPNGAGKSTIIQRVITVAWPHTTVVNADVIAARQWPGEAEAHAYEAARIAAATRSRLIDLGMPLIAETVFSHPSKLDLIDQAHAAGYVVALHVVLVPEALAVARVTSRVRSGGHSVPEDKIRSRYQRLWPIVAQAIVMADSATVRDNSRQDGPSTVALFSHGIPVGNLAWPRWTPSALTDAWPATP